MILSDNEVSDHSDVQEVEVGNPAMADAMRKVLSIGKNSNKSSVVLAKAKVLTKSKEKPKTKHPGFEIEKTGNGPEEGEEIKEEVEEDVKDEKLFKKKRIKRQDIASVGRLKPSALDRDRERPLVKIATRGVVQLFNAVREQQKVIEKKVEEVGPSITKREKVMKSIDKKAFLDVLRGCAETSKNPDPEIKTEDENEDDDKPNWSVLRDDFMMGAKLKDWDKKKEEEDEDSDGTTPKRRKNK